MKKTILLIACVTVLSSCMKYKEPGVEPTSYGITMTNVVLNQNTATLDPFTIAFRLNTLITEGDGTYEGIATVPAETRNKLFGSGVTIELDKTAGFYTLNFRGGAPEGDFTRSGSVKIKTNGYNTLAEAGAQWEVLIPNDLPYQWALDVVYDISAKGYVIQTVEPNTWKVTFTSFQGENTKVGKSDWTGTYTIHQLSGTQKLADVSKSIYSLAMNVDIGTTMFMKDKLNAYTERDRPMYINPACAQFSIVGNGVLLTTIMEEDVKSVSRCTWLGDTPETCSVGFNIYYNGDSKDYLP